MAEMSPVTTDTRSSDAAPARQRRLWVAIGDIHGRRDLLDRLLDKLDQKLGDREYQLVFLGDYVDRGTQSREVIEKLLRIKETRPDTIFLKGNHEEAMLDFLGAGPLAEGWIAWGGLQTLQSYGIEPANHDPADLQESFAEALPDAHFNFLMGLERYHDAGPYLFVHAGLSPERPIDAQFDKDLLWIREDFFSADPAAFDGKTIVHGHTPTKKPENVGWRINVDTGAVWSNKLTAVVLGGKRPAFMST